MRSTITILLFLLTLPTVALAESVSGQVYFNLANNDKEAIYKQAYEAELSNQAAQLSAESAAVEPVTSITPVAPVATPINASQLKSNIEASNKEVVKPQARTTPDVFSLQVVPLNINEQKALEMAQKWAKNPNKPIVLGNGKVVYLFGATIPSIIAAPFQVCDVELQAGEIVQEIILGDTARWQLEVGNAGSSQGNIPHLMIKPMDTGLETSAVVTTNRRVYHFRLVSQRRDFIHYMGFMYPEESLRRVQEQQAQAQQDRIRQSTIIDGQQLNLADLDFNYTIKGKANWKPVQVYSDGLKTYIRMPQKVDEMPVLLAKDTLINYRVQNKVFVVDGAFKELTLVLGVGSGQEKVTILKKF